MALFAYLFKVYFITLFGDFTQDFTSKSCNLGLERFVREGEITCVLVSEGEVISGGAMFATLNSFPLKKLSRRSFDWVFPTFGVIFPLLLFIRVFTGFGRRFDINFDFLNVFSNVKLLLVL